MDWNVLDIYGGVKKFYDNVGGLFDAEFFYITPAAEIFKMLIFKRLIL